MLPGKKEEHLRQLSTSQPLSLTSAGFLCCHSSTRTYKKFISNISEPQLPPRPLTGFILRSKTTPNLVTGATRRGGKKSKLHLEWFLKEWRKKKKSMLRQILLIFQVLFHPISQTWLYFKSVLQDGAGLNSGELSRHQEHCAVSTHCWAHCRCSKLFPFLCSILWIIRKRPAIQFSEAFWGGFSPEYDRQHRSVERELQPSHLFALSLFPNPLIIQKLNLCTKCFSFSSILI